MVPSRGRLWVFPCHMPSGIVACCAEVCRSPSFLTSRCCLSLLENDPGDAHYIDLTRGLVPSKHCNWCPSVKISCLRDFWCHLLLFRCCCCCYLSPRSVHTADQQIEKSNLVDFAFRIIVLLHPSPGFEYFIEHVNKISQNHFVCPFQCSNFCGKHSCKRRKN